MDRRIVVPDGMLKAADEEIRLCSSISSTISDRTIAIIQKVTLEAALRWISENPVVPTESQLAEITAKAKKRASDEPWSHSGEHWATFYSVEWQKMMFVAPEGPSEDAKRIGQRMCGVTFTPQDADYLINQVILASAPGYVPPFLDPKGLRNK